MNSYSIKRFAENHKAALTIIVLVILTIAIIFIGSGCTFYGSAGAAIGKHGQDTLAALDAKEGAPVSHHGDSEKSQIFTSRPARD